MNAREHYLTAEELVERAAEVEAGRTIDQRRDLILSAQVHALLALVAAVEGQGFA